MDAYRTFAPIASAARLTLVAAFVLVTAAAGRADACSCVENGPPCQAFWQDGAVVFVGRVTHIQTADPAALAEGRRMRRVTLRVTEPFAGTTAAPVVVHTGMGQGDCGYPFKLDAEYIVYAHRGSDGKLTTGTCSRTALVEKASTDLAYARSIVEGTATSGGIRGSVQLSPVTLTRPSVRSRPMPGATVVVSGAAEARVTTGPDGRFAADGLPAGEYTVAVHVPTDYYAKVWPSELRLADPRACVEVGALVRYDGRVRGRVVDTRGDPVPGLTIDLVAPSALDADPLVEPRRTLSDGDGRFEIAHVPPGRFVVGINTRRSGDGSLLGPQAFYPGTTAAAQARVTTLGPGARVTLGDFVLPASTPHAAVRGTVTGSDGAPVAGAKVYLKGPEEGSYVLSEPAVTGVDGRFVLAVAVGEQYQLFAEHVVEEEGRRRIATSEPVRLTGVPGLAELTLLLRPAY
jgi:hypothetical protein